MTNKMICSAFNDKYAQLKEALRGGELNRMKDLALEVHAMVHPAQVSGRGESTIADIVFAQMADGGQNKPVPRENYETDLHYAGTDTVPLCWQFWHTYRIEDLVSNIMLADKPQIFDGQWQQRMGASITDTGNALETDEAAAFARGIDIGALWEYMLAVAKNTRDIIEGLTLEQIQSMVPEERVMRILEQGGVTTDFRSVWLLVFWGRLTGGGMILTPFTGHHMMHLPACLGGMPIML